VKQASSTKNIPPRGTLSSIFKESDSSMPARKNGFAGNEREALSLNWGIFSLETMKRPMS
ncbi:MAG TPA: hypothetical protein VJ990_08075, partial [Clostridia bacterium]|nr:hypothetical protein [Clostridia bacterium]